MRELAFTLNAAVLCINAALGIDGTVVLAAGAVVEVAAALAVASEECSLVEARQFADQRDAAAGKALLQGFPHATQQPHGPAG